MNFWEFKEDHSRGYYLPASNKSARDQGGQLVKGLFFFIANLFRAVWTLLVGFCAVLFMLFNGLWKLIKR
ncbi:hypothetical protein [Niabella aquatica]